MNNKTYNVIIYKQGDIDATVAEKLASLFKISVEKANAILQKERFVIKKQVDKNTAEKFYKAINNTGAHCQLEEIPEPEEELALPEIEEVETHSSVKPLLDPTRPEIKPLDDEKVDLSLEARPVEKSNNDEQGQVIEDINPENFCPECGTIRASATSSCVHCGYDPAIEKQGQTRTKVIRLSIILLVLLVIGFIAWPFYQQFTKKMQIEEDLKLAFDTRNQVTEFIQQTNFWPNQNIDANLPKDLYNRSLKSVIVGESAVITATLRGDILDGEDQTLVFTPNTLKGRIVWNCLKGTLKESYRPEICIARERPE